MTKEVYQEALEAYANPLHEHIIKPITSGLINQSFKVTSKITGGSFLLQKINHYVFPEPELVQHNYEMLWKYFQSEEINFIIPEPKYFLGDVLFFCDSKNNYWRVFEFIEGSVTLPVAEKVSEVRTVAETFGRFTASMSGFDAGQLNIVIPGFHNLSLRFKQFSESLHHKNYERLHKVAWLIRELKARERYANLFDVMTESAEFPQRVMHHDAKITNILFDEDSSKVICPVDFDTVMPGYFFSDIGDMIRSMASSLDENNIDFDNMTIRKDFYEAILKGYMEEMKDLLTDAEKKYIHFSGIIMIYMQALRFLSDYLNGDIYYKINYPEQNFDRTKNQLTLLQRLEEFLFTEYQFKV
jgi:Ser/Thr protein kinase RdoA (MazF antagonist)